MSGRDFADLIVDHFDEMLEQSASAPLVMGIALHPYLVGQPHRLRPLRSALRHLAAARGNVVDDAGAHLRGRRADRLRRGVVRTVARAAAHRRCR
jgi:hypothetical protein